MSEDTLPAKTEVLRVLSEELDKHRLSREQLMRIARNSGFRKDLDKAILKMTLEFIGLIL